MKNYSTDKIREKWLAFFKAKGHYIIPYSSLIPVNDKSLLWINSGVATLKKYFEGKKNPPSSRLVNSQKSIRTNDIENVGHTTRHHTLFEMLGNFSIGDYFKKEAISFAWEFLTSKKWLGMDPSRIYITLYEKDKISYDFWINNIKLDKSRIIKGNKKTNFWEIGLGPSGPNCEIFYDRGIKYDSKNRGIELLKKDIENSRYIEIWNIVFSEFNSDGKGNYTTLPRKNIDTGAGLERFATILQNVPTSFDIDIFQKIIHKIEEFSDYKYEINNFFKNDPKQQKINIAFKVIADHIRAIVFTIADGVFPSNKERGYVIRRLIRRAIIYSKNLNINSIFLYKLVDITIKVMKNYYSYLELKALLIKDIIKQEEKKFLNILKEGQKKLLEAIKSKKNIDEKFIFILFESFGFPYDLSEEILNQYNIKFDKNKFLKLLNNHKEKARKALKNNLSLSKQNPFLMKLKLNSKSIFVGYDTLETNNSKVILMFKDEKIIKEIKNDKAYIILDKTPFYAIKGGQQADRGIIKKDNTVCNVLDVFLGPNNEHIHYLDVKGTLKLNDLVKTFVDKKIRINAARNHSGTHILHAAVRKVLGKNAMQVGSYNDKNRIRLDISYNKNITNNDILKINDIIQNAINQKIKCEIIYAPYQIAINKFKALSFFKNRYDKTKNVRIIKFNNFSLELCGGTHVKNSFDIQCLLITKLESKGNNIYRFHALTSFKTIKSFLDEKIKLLENKINNDISSELLMLKNISYNSNLFIILNKINNLNLKLNILENKNKKEFQRINKRKIFLQYINLKVLFKKDNISFLIHNFDKIDNKILKDLIIYYKNKINNNLIIIFNNKIDSNQGTLILSITKDLESKLKANEIINKWNKIINGKGGGNSLTAQCGYKDSNQLNKILINVKDYL